MNQSVVLIGAGNLATSLAIALHIAQIPVTQVYSRTIESAKSLALKVGAEPINSIERLQTNANIFIIALPDEVIPHVIVKLAKLSGIVVHTSGSTPISVFDGINAKGYGVFYPFQTFSRSRVIPFDDIPICLEASDDETFNQLNHLARTLSSTVVPMDSEQRKWLHLSGVFACNFTNHMLAVAYRLTAEHNIEFNLVKPLVDETIRKAFEGNPAHFQTGPAVRNDKQTIERHIQMLTVTGLADLYKELSLSIQNMAKDLKG